MGHILPLVYQYLEGDPDASGKIIEAMDPLIRATARRIYCMEYEDACQELRLALVQALPHLNREFEEGACVSYLQTVVRNQYNKICHRSLSRPLEKSLDDDMETIKEGSISADETFCEFKIYIESFPQNSKERKILTLFFYDGMNDTEIAQRVHLSRQYVNRLKKKLVREYFR